MKKAFTLVELLIVIAIIGILAIGILIALDPVEQTRKASDAIVVKLGITLTQIMDIVSN